MSPQSAARATSLLRKACAGSHPALTITQAKLRDVAEPAAAEARAGPAGRGGENPDPPASLLTDVEDDLLGLDLAVLYQVEAGTRGRRPSTERAARHPQVQGDQRVALIARCA